MLAGDGFCAPCAPQVAPSRPRSWLLQVQSLVHAADPDAFQADHAPGIDPCEHLDGVAGPGGDLGGRDARVEPPGDAGVAQVVGTFHQRRGELVGGERGGADFLPDLPPGGRLDGVAVLGPEQPAIGRGAERGDVGAEEFGELGRDGDLADRPAGVGGGAAFGAAFEAAVLVDLAAVGVGPARGGAGVGEGQVAPSGLGQVEPGDVGVVGFGVAGLGAGRGLVGLRSR